jgi:hypothetical protein
VPAPRHPRRADRQACLLHVPKCGGDAITSALEAALPPNSLAPLRLDTSIFCDFDDFDALRQEARAQLIARPGEVRALRNYRAIAGHFSLSTLRSVVPISAICTVLREPRARLLSLYTYWRTARTTDDFWAPYRVGANAWRPLTEFLSDARLAPATDNQVSRMLLADDPRLPRSSFAAESDVDAVARDAIALLDAFGFVGILELGEHAWRGVGEHFGVSLDQRQTNVTGELGSAASSGDDGNVLTDGVLELLEQRSGADALIYDHALAAAGIASRAERQRISNHAFAAQLVRLGDLCGASAAKAARHDARERALEEALRRKDEELARARGWVQALQESASWRVTAPLRSAKQWIRGKRPKRTIAR